MVGRHARDLDDAIEPLHNNILIATMGNHGLYLAIYDHVCSYGAPYPRVAEDLYALVKDGIETRAENIISHVTAAIDHEIRHMDKARKADARGNRSDEISRRVINVTAEQQRKLRQLFRDNPP
jgi:hypothetical protein